MPATLFSLKSWMHQELVAEAEGRGLFGILLFLIESNPHFLAPKCPTGGHCYWGISVAKFSARPSAARG